MSRIVYFVVGVDIDEKQIFIDDTVFTARFDQGLYDTETREWRSEDWDNEYIPALEALHLSLLPATTEEETK